MGAATALTIPGCQAQVTLEGVMHKLYSIFWDSINYFSSIDNFNIVKDVLNNSVSRVLRD